MPFHSPRVKRLSISLRIHFALKRRFPGSVIVAPIYLILIDLLFLIAAGGVFFVTHEFDIRVSVGFDKFDLVSFKDDVANDAANENIDHTIDYYNRHSQILHHRNTTLELKQKVKGRLRKYQ
jgi:hypothetical protein